MDIERHKHLSVYLCFVRSFPQPVDYFAHTTRTTHLLILTSESLPTIYISYIFKVFVTDKRCEEKTMYFCFIGQNLPSRFIDFGNFICKSCQIDIRVFFSRNSYIFFQFRYAFNLGFYTILIINIVKTLTLSKYDCD